MPAPRLTFPCGPATITLDPSGSVRSVVHRQRPAHSCLRGGRPFVRIAGDLTLGDQGQPYLGEPRLVADVDEAEFTWTRGPVRAEVRHSFTAGWGVRVVVSNRGDQRLELDGAGLGWVPDPAWCVRALAAGATGAYAVFPADADGPLLGGSLRVGTFEAVSATGMSFGPVTLDPGARYVVQWQWDWYANPHAFDASAGTASRRHPSVPRSLYCIDDERAAVSVDEDTALVLPNGVVSEVVDGLTEIWGYASREAHPVKVVSARGVTHFDLHVTEQLEQRLRQAAELALSVRRGANGVPLLADAHAALAVQQALRARVVDEPYAAEDAVELFVAAAVDVSDQLEPTPVMISLLCGEAERTGDVERLSDATALILTHNHPDAGLGLAATRVCVSRVLRNLDVRPVTDHLVELGRTVAGAALADRAARVELLLVTGTGGDEVLAELAALGRALGAGLTGVGVQPLDPELLAQLAAVFSLATPAVSATVSSGWATSGQELGRRAEAEALFRIAGKPAGRALSLMLTGSGRVGP